MHQFFLFGILAVLLLLSLVTGNFLFNLGLLWWLLGAISGFLFVFTDKLIFDFLMKSEETMEVKLGDVFKEKKFSEGVVRLLAENFEQRQLIMRSFLFLMVWVVLALLTVTSVINPFARGLMLGIGIHLIFDMLYDYFYNKPRFDQWFWQIKRELSNQEKQWFVYLILMVFAFLALRF